MFRQKETFCLCFAFSNRYSMIFSRKKHRNTATAVLKNDCTSHWDTVLHVGSSTCSVEMTSCSRENDSLWLNTKSKVDVSKTRSLLQYLKRSSIFQKFRKLRNCIKIVFTRLNHHCEVSKQTDQRPTLQCLQLCVGLYQPFSALYFHTIGSMGRPETHKGCVMAILGL